MIYGKVPFNDQRELILLRMIQRNNIDFNHNGITISPLLQDLIQRMLIPDPVIRINWIDIYQHELFRGNQEIINDDFYLNIDLNDYTNRDYEQNLLDNERNQLNNEQNLLNVIDLESGSGEEKKFHCFFFSYLFRLFCGKSH